MSVVCIKYRIFTDAFYSLYVTKPIMTTGHVHRVVRPTPSQTATQNTALAKSHQYYFITLQNFAKYSTHSGFPCLSVCHCVWMCVCVSINFLVYSITKTILPGSSPHLLRTFLVSIPSFLLILGSFRKTRWPPCLFFYYIFSH